MILLQNKLNTTANNNMSSFRSVWQIIYVIENKYIPKVFLTERKRMLVMRRIAVKNIDLHVRRDMLNQPSVSCVFDAVAEICSTGEKMQQHIKTVPSTGCQM